MDMQTALRTRLMADAPIAAVAGTRIDWMERPQGNPLPSITLQTISDPRPQHLKGFQRLRETRVQVDCWADDYATARALAELVITAAVPATIVDDVRFDRAMVEGPRDLTNENDVGAIKRASLDLFIWHAKIEGGS